jgi:hypothetical protein
MTEDRLPTSIREINGLPEQQKHAIYRTLLPNWLFTSYGVDQETLSVDGQRVVQFRCPSGSRAVEIIARRHPTDTDPTLYLNMADTFNTNSWCRWSLDPDAPRFDTDVDTEGNPTQFGTVSRNLTVERAAIEAGLAPGQIRRGLRSFKQSVPIFEDFVSRMGHDLFLIEPLAYHNAIVFERYGFNYLRGHREMARINAEFQPGGALHSKLIPDNPFRQPDAWRTIRGRSWAIHDGILGHPFTGFQMYKRIGIQAGIDTFPNAEW